MSRTTDRTTDTSNSLNANPFDPSRRFGANKLRVNKKQFYAILYNIRSAHNVGAIFRTADGAGISKLYLCGYTPTPETSPAIAHEIAKTALGAETFIPWEHWRQTARLIKKLIGEGVRIVALEQTSKSIPYFNFKPAFPLCLIVGNEVTGVSKSILSLANDIIEIPMRGKKESLNVSVAFGIAAYNFIQRVPKKSSRMNLREL